MVLMRCDWCWLVGMVRSCVVLYFAWSVLARVALFMFFTGGIDLSVVLVRRECCELFVSPSVVV